MTPNRDNKPAGSTQLWPQSREWPKWVGYSVAVVSVAVLTTALLAMEPAFPMGHYPVPFVLLTMIIAYVFGLGPAIAACVVGYLAFDYFFIPPLHTVLTISNTPDSWARQVAFVLGVIVVSIATAQARASMRRIQRLADESALLYTNLKQEVVERQRAEVEQARLAAIVEYSEDAIIGMDLGGTILNWNHGAQRVYGYTEEEALGKSISMIVPSDRLEEIPLFLAAIGRGEHVDQFDTERLAKDGRRIDVSISVSPIKDGAGNIIAASTIARDITERKQSERERETTVTFLRLANASGGTREMVHAAATFFQQQSGCEAVGIRLREEDDYPYCEARGFPSEFVKMENSLCARNAEGEVMRDSAGYSIQECMCGNVICGRFDPTKPFFTPNGSFWTNSTTQLLAGTTESDRQARTRNTCNGEGYESVALIPLRIGEERLGLLQLNDHREGMFTSELITMWERLADQLAITLGKFAADEALRESEERFRVMVDAIPQLAWMAEPDGYIFWYNQRWYEYTGTTPEQMAGWGWQRVHDPDMLPKVIERWKASLDTGLPFGMEFPLLGADGEFRWFLTRVMPLKDSEGRITRWFGTNTDVSDKREAEEMLAKQAVALQEQAQLLDLAHVLIRDPDDRIVSWNSGAEALYGFSREEAVGRVSHDLFQTVFTESKETLASSLAATGHWQGELIHTAKNGRKVVVASHQVLHRADDGKLVATIEVNNDVTDLKEAQEELGRAFHELDVLNSELEERVQRRTADLEAANKELEAFSYSVSHDLRAPLRAISGFSDSLLKMYQEKLDARGQDYLRRVRNAAQRMGQLIDDILDLSRASRAEMHRETVNLSEVAMDVLDELRKTEPDRKVEVSVEPGLVVSADAHLIRIAIQNLLGNAWKFTGKRDVGRIEVGAAEQNTERVYYVRDNGAGFDPAYAEKLFSPFQRMHSDNEFPGTGIGLALVQRILHRHGGIAWAESAVEQGATFYFTLGEADR